MASNATEAGYSVHAQLREFLARGQLQPGLTYSLRGLARALGVSPMPVRTALAMLVAEGALEVLPNRTVRVPEVTDSRYFELCEIRAALESLAAQWAVGFAPTALAAELNALNRRYLAALRASDREAIFSANRAFHFTLYSHCKAPALLRLIENIWLQTGPYVNLTFQHQTASSAAGGNHRRIVEAVAAQDAHACREAVMADIRDACAFTLAEINRRRSRR